MYEVPNFKSREQPIFETFFAKFCEGVDRNVGEYLPPPLFFKGVTQDSITTGSRIHTSIPNTALLGAHVPTTPHSSV
jgi:hypothetical protein